MATFARSTAWTSARRLADQIAVIDHGKAIANANPITTIVDALRALWLGAHAGTDIWVGLVWCVGIIAAFSVLATARYRCTVAR